MKHRHFILAIRCPGCGHTGSAAWKGEAGKPDSVRCELLLLSNGFRHEAHETPGQRRIICDRCQTLLPD